MGTLLSNEIMRQRGPVERGAMKYTVMRYTSVKYPPVRYAPVKWGKRCLIVKLRNSSCYLCLAMPRLRRGSHAREAHTREMHL
jgi:hypothetical protein